MEGGGDHREARRPMNSFFIFCKRHRHIVRDQYKNLDNRSISRILGELWAKLDPKEKQQYTAAARQYKDAFLKANPDYKWHNNNDKSHVLSTVNQELSDLEKNQEKLECCSERHDSNNIDLLIRAIELNGKECFVKQEFNENKNGLHLAHTVGKSSFLTEKDNTHSTTIMNHEVRGNMNENIEYAVKQGWACKNEEENCLQALHHKSPEYPAKDYSPSTSSPTYTMKDDNESDASKSHQSDTSGEVNWKKQDDLENCQQQVDYSYRDARLPLRKSKRTNKGAIYKQLIATGALPASRERLAEMQTIYNVNSDDGAELRETPYHEKLNRGTKRTAHESDTQADKRYKTGDFDLDAKIATLPACSMEVLEKNHKNSTKQRLSAERLRRPSGGNNKVMKTDMLFAPPHRKRQRNVSFPMGSCKRKQSKASIMKVIRLPPEYRQHFSQFMKNPLTTLFLHPLMKSYQDVQKQTLSSPDRAASTSDDSFESKEDNSSAAANVQQQTCSKKDDTVAVTNSATSPLKLSTMPKMVATSNVKVSIQEKPIHNSAVVQSDYKSVTTMPNSSCSDLMPSSSCSDLMPSSSCSDLMPPSVYQAAVSSLDISLRSTQVTAAHTSSIPLAAVAAAVVSEPMQSPVSMELVPTSSGLHVSGELKMSDNPDFLMWISNLAEAAGQIPVC